MAHRLTGHEIAVARILQRIGGQDVTFTREVARALGVPAERPAPAPVEEPKEEPR